MLYEFDHQQLDKVVSPADALTPSDDSLIVRIQARDEAALSVLMNRHKALLRTVISRVVHTDADVDDTLQDVFIELWNRSHLFDATKGKILGWIITMARRRAIDRVRRRQAYDRAEERMRLQAEAAGLDILEHGADEDACDSDRAAALRQVLTTLPAAQREAVELAYYHGLSQREISAKTGIPLGTIKTRLELGVRKIRTAILQLGGAAEWSLNHA
jgi:RNA polymerase sigma-70 factor (ECF subfamily)